MPHLFDRLDFQFESVGQRLLGKPRIDSDAQRAGRELEESEAARRIEMVEHPGKHARRVHLARRAKPLDCVGNADRRVVHLGRFAGRRRPQ